MTNVKPSPETLQMAREWIDDIDRGRSRHRTIAECVAELINDIHGSEKLITKLRSDLDTARADARVLAEECAAARNGMWNGIDDAMYYGGSQAERLLDLRKATDASGALERSRP